MLQHSLGIPAAFTLSKGFIKELRVHIPWSSITSAPVEVTFTGVECVLHFNPTAEETPTPLLTPPATPRAQSTLPPTAPTTPSNPPEDDSGGWASDLITKIIANLSLHVHDLSLKYLEGDVCACLRLPSLSLHSTDPSWRSSAFMDLLGPWKLIHKVLTVNHLSFFLYPDGGKVATPVKNERVCILQQLSISCRIKSYLAALGATADLTSWSTNALATTATPSSLLPSSAGVGVGGVGGPPNTKALPRPLPPPCGPAITVDVHVLETVDLSLSSYQFERLHSLIQSKSDFYATSAAAARVAQSIAAVPAVIAQQDQHAKDKKRTLKAKPPNHSGRPPSSTPNTGGGVGGDPSAPGGAKRGSGGGDSNGRGEGASKGWMSWMWDFVAAEEEEDDDHLHLKEREERLLFFSTMGHLAPSDEIVFCLHMKAIALHIRSDEEEGEEEEETPLPSATELTTDRVLSAKSQTPSPPRSYPLSASSALSSLPFLDNPPPLSATPTLQSSWSSASSFASLHIHELGMILSQPLLLAKPTTSSSSPSSANSSTLPSAGAVKPPTFCVNVQFSLSVSRRLSLSCTPRRPHVRP